MTGKGVEQTEKTRFVRGGKKTHKAFRFVIENPNAIGRWMRESGQNVERHQILRGDRFGVRLRNVTACAFVTRVRVFGNELRETFIEPARNSVGVKAMENEVDDFVTEKVIAELVGGISLNEQTARRMNSARPLFQVSVGLKFLPFFRTLENVDVRFDAGGELLALELFGNDAIMELSFDRNGSRDVTVNEMIDEMFALGVFPLLGMNRERFFAERVRIALA